MRIWLWGTRGSIACAGPSTVRYGGDTACLEVTDDAGNGLILDAGSGIRPLGSSDSDERFDILLTHLHMDHIQGLPFFVPMLDEREVHVWGPISTTASLPERLGRYLSPPLFPVTVRDLDNVFFHDVPPGRFEIGPFEIEADLVIHPGATLGYRITLDGSSIAYIPDHEPALGSFELPSDPEWISGFGLMDGVSALIHDSQYTDEEYRPRVGWGHTSLSQLARLADITGAGKLVTFHHDPSHDDDMLDRFHEELTEAVTNVEVVPGVGGLNLEV